MKKIIFDIGHPAQVYQFLELNKALTMNGWECLYVAKDKEITRYLLETLDLNHVILSKNKKGLINKVLSVPVEDFKFYQIVRKFKPDFILNRFSIHSGHVSKLLNITNIAFSDTEHANKLHALTMPFVDIKITGKSYYIDLGKNQIRLDTNFEFYYLHPDFFTDKCNPYNVLNIKQDEKYCIVRFVSWGAHHDIGVQRLSTEERIKLVERLNKRYRVFISSEGVLPEKLLKYKLEAKPEYMHTLLKYASLYIGEGGTMASEAACLNTPAIYTNKLPLMGYLKEQADNNLLFHKTKLEDILNIIELQLVKNESNFSDYISSKINPINFLVWFIENYPSSVRIMKENPDYQYNFR